MNGLSLNCAVMRSIDPHRLGMGWTNEMELLAVVAELLDANTRTLIAMNTKKGTRLPQPIYIRRPDEQIRKKKHTPGDTKKFLKNKGIPVRRAPKKKKGR